MKPNHPNRGILTLCEKKIQQERLTFFFSLKCRGNRNSSKFMVFTVTTTCIHIQKRSWRKIEVDVLGEEERNTLKKSVGAAAVENPDFSCKRGF